MRRGLLALGLVAAVLAAPAATRADGPPTAVIQRPDEVGRGDEAVFDGSSSQNAAELVWDFGDGAQAVGPVVRHRYQRGGAYIVSLTARNVSGQWAHAFSEIRVAPYIEGKVVEPVEIASQGFVLRGTVTRPAAEGRFPAILEYGPYAAGSVGDGNFNRSLIRSGYAFVKVAMPGRDRSDGAFDMFGPSTAQGGFDAVEWIAAQPWSDGKVAMTGFSGPAVAAMATLPTRPPHLVAAALKGAFSDFYRDEAHPGGTTNSNTFVNAWNALFYAEPATLGDKTPWAQVPQREADITRAAADMAARTTYDEWWRRRTPTAMGAPSVPVLYYGSHRDLWPRAAPELLRWLRPAGGRVSLVYGGHGPIDPTGFNPAMQTAQEGGWGESALGETRAWFDRFLGGVQNGVDHGAAMRVLVPRGADWNASLGYQWLSLDDWPASSVRYERWAAPAGPPVTALGGAGWGASGNAEADGAQQVVFDFPTLADDLTVAGPATLRLSAALDGVDASWNVQLQEVLADGSVRMVQDGQLAASHRALDPVRTRRDAAGRVVQPFHPHDRMEPVDPGVAYEYLVEIPAVFNTFMAGSRVRVVIAANDVRPVLDGHATAPTSARFTVFRDAARPTALVLPVVTGR